jgi:hypothetical protein
MMSVANNTPVSVTGAEILMSLFGNSRRPAGVCRGGWEQATSHKGVTTWLKRIARDQESRIAASTLVGLNAAKPFIQFQTSMLRLWADNFELVARNYENGLERGVPAERRVPAR